MGTVHTIPMAKIERVGQFGEIAPSKMKLGGNSVYLKELEGIIFNSFDHSLAARKAMAYKSALQNQGETKDVFTCSARSWDLIFSNIGEDVLIEVYDKTTSTLTNITVTKAHISTFAWVIEIPVGNFSYNTGVNPIKGTSVIYIGGINQPLIYIDDDLLIKKWRVTIGSGYIETPIIEDMDLFQGRLTILVPKGLGATMLGVERYDDLEDIGINTPWIYMSGANSFDDYTVGQRIETKPLNYAIQKFYAITAFRNVLAVIHSGGLSIIKAKDEATIGLTQINQIYYPADQSEALPIKAVGFNNILVYLSRTGPRGRTLLEDPLTNQMTGFKIPVMAQRFLKQPTRMFKKDALSQLCVYDGKNLYSFCEAITTEGGGQVFPRTTYIKSNKDITVKAISETAAVLQVGDTRFLVNDDQSDVLSVGLIDNYFPRANVVAHGDDWVELNIAPAISKIAINLADSWRILYRLGNGRFSGLSGNIPDPMPTTVQLIPLAGSSIMSLYPPAMHTDSYQWHLNINNKEVIITGDTIDLSVDAPLVVMNSKICAYALPINIVMACTASQYGQDTIQGMYLLTDRDIEPLSTFNQIPERQRHVEGVPSEYRFGIKFNPTQRIFNLKIIPTLGKTDELVIEQLCISL